MKQIGLILEGGGSRGVFTSGILDFLMEQEVVFPYVSGVSFGACNATSYVSGQIGRTRDCMLVSGSGEPVMGRRYFLKKRKFIDMDRVFDTFPNQEFPFDYDAYFASDIHCEMVVTNCLTGKAEYLSEAQDRQRLMAICRASSSMPLVSPITYVDDTPYLDGGLSDSVPVKRAMSQGYKKNVIVLTRNRGYEKKPEPLMQHLVYNGYRKYPELIKAYYYRPRIYNQTIAYIEALEKQGKVFVIRPEFPVISRMEDNAETLMAFYNHGYDMMEEKIDELKEFMNS